MIFPRAIIEDYLDSHSLASVAHYTRIGTLCHFLPEGSKGWGSARATPVQFLNDRKELSLGLEVLKEIANRAPRSGVRVRSIISDLLSSFGKLKTDAFQMSFSGNPDELGQWRGYASNGMGCCVVTDPAELSELADVAGWVLYEPSKQKAFAYKVLARLRGISDNDYLQQALVAAASFMKHPGFSPELEFRVLLFPDPTLVQFRESGDRLVPFVDFLSDRAALTVQRIVIGPGWQLAGLDAAELAKHHVAQGIERLLTARGLHETGIETSRIPYDPR